LITSQKGRLSPDRTGEFGEFCRASYAATLRRAYRISGGREQSAQDATQEAYLRAMERWETLRGLADGQKRAWLGQAVANIMMDAWRSQNRAPALVRLTDAEGYPGAAVLPPDADQVVLAQWYRQVCAAAATRLSGRCREAFALHYLAGYEIREVAAMLGITATTVRVHLSNARRQLLSDATAVAGVRAALQHEGA
jgi:RNA polymerase sigma-70 factor (ECF subfamily)